MKIRNPLVHVRDTKAAAQLAYVGGSLLLATGSTGAVATIQLGWRLVDALSSSAAEILEPMFLILGLVAAMGGITVIAAGWTLTRQRATGKALLWLGSGVGLLTLMIQIAALLIAGRDPATDLLKSATTVQGMAVLVVILAQLRA